MPDDMLEDSIAIAKKTLDEHDFETDGVEVSHRVVILKRIQIKQMQTKHINHIFIHLDRKKGQEVHGREMGAILARFPGQVIRMSLSARAQPLRLLHIRAQQDLLPHLQGFMNN